MKSNPEPEDMTLTEIAKEINGFLKKFEDDPTINTINPKTKLHQYYYAKAYRGGKKVMVTYLAFQGRSSLDRDDAIQYLKWLRAGNVGSHYAMRRDAGGRLVSE